MKPIVMLDGGHGGHDSGAVGPTGLREKDVALSVVQLTASLLIAAGVTVLYTRKDDRFIELSQRARIANDAKADLFVSIHCNSAEKAAAGFEVFTTPGQTKSDAAATEAFKAFGREFPNATRRMDSTDGDPDKEANFAVLRLTDMPAFLFELEFIHTAQGEAFLRDASNLARCAKALAAGILEWLRMPQPVTAVLDVTDDEAELVTRLREVLANFKRQQDEARALFRESIAKLEENGLRLEALGKQIEALGGKGEA